MKKRLPYALVITLLLVPPYHCLGKKYRGGNNSSPPAEIKQNAAGCSAAAGFRYLNVNNVRARINTGGDMWWDLTNFSQYFIPANGNATSLYAGSLWIGGLDVNDQLKLAALRFRGSGNDYWPGPLTIDGTASVDEVTCAEYDKHFRMTRAEIDEYLGWWHSEDRATEYPDYSIPKSILDYPAHGDVAKNQSYYLAPFRDVDGDGDYDPNAGDYPYYDITNELCPLNFAGDPSYVPQQTMEETQAGTVHGSILVDQVLKGDETLWWIFNDKGNFHSETQGASIGFEIRAQAFGFSTNDEINNMTFYTYEIINRSTFTLQNTFFSPWVDTDLGYSDDDYVGCDVARGLGYCYNGKSVDGNSQPEAYGDQPPAIGVDFFQGPYINPDGRDNPEFTGDCSIINSPFEWDQMAINGVNFGNDIIDDERFGMRRFVYHNNDNSPQGDPRIAPEYYNYLRGFWRDNTHMLYGGNAHFNSGAVGPECDFMFPGDSDPCNWGTQGIPPNGGYNQNGLYWTEENADNNPFDRRFMQSAGPFTLEPGAVNYITVGIPWARASSGGPWASVELLRVVDDKCQKLFDNCFKVLDGPDAPDMSIVELNKELIFYLSNSQISNNYLEEYLEYDNTITQPHPIDSTQRSDSLYRFEGYQIYQLANATITLESKDNPDMVRLVAQFDMKNGVGMLVNYYYNKDIQANVPIVEVEGGDNGVRHSFMITEDAFGTTNRQLTNFKQYYYTVVAYSYNEYMQYSQEPGILNGLLGQKKPYLAGRRNIRTYTAIPHPTVNGTVLNSSYGLGPSISRIEGNGNGGMLLELTDESMEEILSRPPADLNNTLGSPDYPIAYDATYEYGLGPLNVKVVDPLNVINAEYRLDFTDVVYSEGDTIKIDSAQWVLKNIVNGDVYVSDKDINLDNEQLFLDLGLSIQINQPLYPGDSLAVNNGLITSYASYQDSSHRWVTGVEDIDLPGSAADWIRAGTYQDQDDPSNLNDWDAPDHPYDPESVFEKIASGTWAPYLLTAYNGQNNTGPSFNRSSKLDSDMADLASVNIVFTADKSKWTRAMVIEMCPESILSEGNARRFELRSAPSVDKDGNPAAAGSGPSNDPDDPNYIGVAGMGWFPGYAINLETGERMNIIFGENSFLVGENGRDMLFNPSPNQYDFSGTPLFGGMHYVYVMDHTIREPNNDSNTYIFPAYDACRQMHTLFDTLIHHPLWQVRYQAMLLSTTMWVGMPLSVEDEEWLPEGNDWKLSIRMSKPYRRYYSLPNNPEYAGTGTNWPAYGFKTEGVATTLYSDSKAETDLDLIRVVPNPYYAYDSYENNALDNRVKITNLPEQTTITIYNINGTLVRQLTKDSDETFMDWDLKNFAGVMVAGGIYIIHVNTNKGERVLKWFGIMRPPDLNTF
ncbi:MAG: T9SS C-terminal target domain-containing protein [Bacteroidetes bacterium]|nr:MAG: T9SS C-terminal target domain-containing protein [Bacteroidota bacterium]RLD82920.1 MAG: T9SS C-terminal target domain-containing protein [Bacteroidota bacterium]